MGGFGIYLKAIIEEGKGYALRGSKVYTDMFDDEDEVMSRSMKAHFTL